MNNGDFVVLMWFRQEAKIALESVFTLEALYFRLHEGDIGRELELRVVMEMNRVVRFTLDELNTLRLDCRAQILKRLVEKAWKQKQTGSLVESLHDPVSPNRLPTTELFAYVSIPLYQAASSARVVILLHDCDFASRARESCRRRNAARARTDNDDARAPRIVLLVDVIAHLQSISLARESKYSAKKKNTLPRGRITNGLLHVLAGAPRQDLSFGAYHSHDVLDPAARNRSAHSWAPRLNSQRKVA
jgi:hypothetical protein